MCTAGLKHQTVGCAGKADIIIFMKYLGVDYGLRRVGLAVSEGSLASAWKVLEVSGLADALEKISGIVVSENIGEIIIGMPGGDIGKATERFIKEMQKKGYKIISWDETLSTRHAQDLMIQLGKSKKTRKLSDAYSAAEILQNYLDSTKKTI